MSIATEIARLQQAKADLKEAINNKGGTLTTETLDQYASAVNALPSPKEEETKTITPNFSSGNVVVTPTSGKVMTQVTINKDSNLIAENIKKDTSVFGVVGTLESGGGEGIPIYEYTLDVTTEYWYYYNEDQYTSNIYLLILFGDKRESEKTIIDNKDYYLYRSVVYATYELFSPDTSPYTRNDGFDMYRLFWGRDLFDGNTSFKIKSTYNPEKYECLGIYYASDDIVTGYTYSDLTMNDAVTYSYSKTSSLPLTNGSVIKEGYTSFFEILQSGNRWSLFRDTSYEKEYYPKLSNQTLLVDYNY